MTNNTDLVTLNIYNHPPEIANNESEGNINQTTDYNLNTDKPKMNSNYYYKPDKDLSQNYNSAPRTKYSKSNNKESSIEDESSETSGNNNNYTPNPAPVLVTPVQYPQQPVYQKMPAQPVIVQQPMAYQYPYNAPYGQPVIIQQGPNNNLNRPVNNAPKTIIIRETREQRKHKTEEDCCTGFLAACGGFLACCCLMGLCCPPHPGYGYHRRW